MRFVLRCIIWLGIVFAAVLRQDGYLVDPTKVVAVARRADVSAMAETAIAAQIATFCRGNGAACLAPAATALRPGEPAAAIARRRFRGAWDAGAP